MISHACSLIHPTHCCLSQLMCPNVEASCEPYVDSSLPVPRTGVKPQPLNLSLSFFFSPLSCCMARAAPFGRCSVTLAFWSHLAGPRRSVDNNLFSRVRQPDIQVESVSLHTRA